MFPIAQARRNLEAAIRDVGSTRPAIRAEAVRDLVGYAEEARDRVIPALERALRDDADPRVRAAAAVALSDVEAIEALPALLVAIEDDDAYVRQMSIAALGELGDPRAGARLQRALQDRRPEVRFQAVIAFPRVCAGRDEAFAALMRATHDDDPLVVHIALRMIEELGAEPAQGEVPDARSAPLELPVEPLDRARALLQHASPAVRAAAAILLARGGDPAPRPILAQVVSGELAGVDREDQAAAIELCGELRLGEARAALERRAFGGVLGLGRDPLHWHARVALARMGHPRAEAEILRELGARDRDRRTMAVAAAGRARLASARPVLLSMRGDAARADPGAVEEALAALGSG